jgi:general secretion pathway protein A
MLQGLLTIEREGMPLVTMVLCGSAYLFRRVRTVRGLSERISVCVSLNPLEHDEVRPYLDHLLQQAGGTGDIFTDDGIGAIFRQTGGMPRRINRVAELAMLAGAAYDVEKIDGSMILNVSGELIANAG